MQTRPARSLRAVVSLALGAALVASLAGAATAAAAPSSTPAPIAGRALGGSAAQQRIEAAARAATARYQDVAVAEAAGYEPVSPCTEVPGLGAMGIHYLRHDLVDDVIDVREPEVLLYLPVGDRLQLIGVEYFQPSEDQDDSDGLDEHDRPHLGAVPFDGPMAGHGPGEPFHYDLHVWVWSHNPAGLYAQFNPALSCSGAPGRGAHQH